MITRNINSDERTARQCIVINDTMVIELIKFKGGQVRLRCVDFGPERTKVDRGEVSDVLLQLIAQEGGLP